MKVDYFNLGALTQLASVQLGGLLTGLTVAPNGNFVYASEGWGQRILGEWNYRGAHKCSTESRNFACQHQRRLCGAFGAIS